MWQCDLVPNTYGIILKFKCIKCDSNIETDEIIIPPPNYSAETTSDSQESDDVIHECVVCSADYTINVCSTFGNTNVEIEELDKDYGVEVDETFDPIENDYIKQALEAIFANPDHLSKFQADIVDIRELSKIKITEWNLEAKHNRHLFVALVSCMESYLSDSIIHLILNNDKYLKAFVKNYKKIDHNIPFRNIFEEYEKIKSTVTDVLINLSFHNLPQIKNVFEQTFGKPFPDFDGVYKKVLIRHDLVHRNGKTKDGSEISIDKEDLISAVDEIVPFIMEVDKVVAALRKETL